MNLLFSEPLPLRTTRELGNYAEDLPLPHRLGNLSASRFKLIRLASDRYFAADHPMTIDAVWIDDASSAAWEAGLESDGRGHSWTVVRFASPIDQSRAVSATGTGALDPATGVLIENPAEIMAYIAGLAGRAERWHGLRAEAAAAGLRLAVSLTDAVSIRAHLDRIVQSAGAIYTPAMGRFYPTPAIAGPVLELDRFEAPDIRVSASLVDTCDVLRLAYDVEEATGRALRHMEFSAKPPRLGGAVMELTLPLLRTPADAESVGRREMIRLAGEKYSVTFAAARTDLRPGQWVKLVDNPDWPLDGADPLMMVLAIDASGDDGASGITAEHVRTAPEVDITAHSIALPDTRQGGVDIEFRNGVATIRVTDTEGRAIKDARVALDGGLPRVTSVDGVVSFIATRGTHTLSLQMPGFDDEALEIEI